VSEEPEVGGVAQESAEPLAAARKLGETPRQQMRKAKVGARRQFSAGKRSRRGENRYRFGPRWPGASAIARRGAPETHPQGHGCDASYLFNSLSRTKKVTIPH